MHEDTPAPAPAQALSTTSAGTAAAHSVTTVERGSFCLARCTCGWAGAARRSRDRARTDADRHLSGPDRRDRPA